MNAIGPDGQHVPIEVSSIAIEGSDHRSSGVFGVLQPARAVHAPPRARHGLTPRQLEVLHHLAQGHSTAQIAEALAIQPETVRNHVRGLLRSLGVHSRLQAVSEARRRGLLADRSDWTMPRPARHGSLGRRWQRTTLPRDGRSSSTSPPGRSSRNRLIEGTTVELGGDGAVLRLPGVGPTEVRLDIRVALPSAASSPRRPLSAGSRPTSSRSPSTGSTPTSAGASARSQEHATRGAATVAGATRARRSGARGRSRPGSSRRRRSGAVQALREDEGGEERRDERLDVANSVARTGRRGGWP